MVKIQVVVHPRGLHMTEAARAYHMCYGQWMDDDEHGFDDAADRDDADDDVASCATSST